MHAVAGYYEDTLNAELQEKLLKNHQPIVFANIDCDLRKLAESVFNFIEPLVRDGTLIYLDDYYCGYGGIFSEVWRAHILNF